MTASIATNQTILGGTAKQAGLDGNVLHLQKLLDIASK